MVELPAIGLLVKTMAQVLPSSSFFIKNNKTSFSFSGAAELNGVARRSQSLRLGRSEFVMINEGNSHSEGRGMNRDTKVSIDMPGDETKLLMESQVSCSRFDEKIS